MTLEEKFINASNIFIEYPEDKIFQKSVCEECVYIADDYAIGFAEWKDTNQIDYLKSTYKELLEIYKKEKGL